MGSFGENLKEVRISKNISQGKLAEVLGIHPSHVSRYERDEVKPSIDVIKKITDALNISADKLIYGSYDNMAKAAVNDDELLEYFHKIQSLPDTDREHIKALLKAFIFQKDVQQKLG